MNIKIIMILFLVTASFFAWDSIWGDCLEQPKDQGDCDTLNLEPTSDTLCESLPALVRVSLLVTHDIVTENDSLAGITLPLCYTHSNPSSYCSVSSYWNKVLWSPASLPCSVFRHQIVSPTDTIHNWMMDLYEAGNGEEWSSIILDLDGSSHFWLSLIASGSEDVRFGSGSRILLATMTFKVQDTMHVCIDSCFWPPESRLAFTDSKSNVYIPRHNLPVCFQVDTADGSSGVKQLGDSENGLPNQFTLKQNYPNPFNPTTNIEFTLYQSAPVTLEIFNLLGQKVRVLLKEQNMSPGIYVVDWDGRTEEGNITPAGIYLYRIKAGDFSDARKMLFLK